MVQFLLVYSAVLPRCSDMPSRHLVLLLIPAAHGTLIPVLPLVVTVGTLVAFLLMMCLLCSIRQMRLQLLRSMNEPPPPSASPLLQKLANVVPRHMCPILASPFAYVWLGATSLPPMKPFRKFMFMLLAEPQLQFEI